MSGRREQVARAAARLFAKHGFHGVTIEDIGSAAGITGPGVYRHFASKDALLAHLLVDISSSLLSGGEGVVVPGEPAATLRRLVRFHLAFSLERPDLIRVHDRDLANLPENDRRRVRRLQRAYVQLWADALIGLGHADTAARARAHATFGLLNSTPHSGAGLERDDLSRVLEEMALAALGLPGAGQASPPAPRAGR